MLAPGIRDVITREQVKEFYVAHKGDADMGAFYQVVTEQMRLREAVFEQGMERGEIVNALCRDNCLPLKGLDRHPRLRWCRGRCLSYP